MDVSPPAGAISMQLGQLQLLIGLDELVMVGPGPDPGRTMLPPDADAIREYVRCDGEGRYRPLPGLRNLPENWHARFSSIEDFSAALDAVYPLAQRHTGLYEDGSLSITSMEELFARQEGRYAIARELSSRGRELARAILCGACVRVPLWAGPGCIENGAIPCPEPCSVMLSLCREAALWEQDRPGSAPASADIPFGAFEEPGNQVREAYLRAMEAQHG